MWRLTTLSRFFAVASSLAFGSALFAATSASAQVVVGPNVNMGGGPAIFTPPSTIIGDPFLQRQNEPSIAVSSRNPCHLLAGANDYRAVDVEEAAGEVGDAWLGVFKSFDCGSTWTSTLMPGHKLDTSAVGIASPIKGLAAAADATVRAGTNGLFYYSGIAFNRGEGEIGKVFVARFLDNNNKDGGDPIAYLGAVAVDTGTSGQFLDKPWIVADIPRNGSTCVINGRAVPAGPVYLVYTSFVGNDTNKPQQKELNVRSKIMFSRSTNCGATWSNPAKLSESVQKNQGTTIAIDPGTGAIHVAWREFATAGDTNSRNAILVARSTDGGQSFTKAAAIETGGYIFQPFDQGSSFFTFRTNAYPALTVVPAVAEGRPAGSPGRVYVAWAARGFGGVRPNDARIVMSSAIGGATWSAPKVADSYTEAGSQIMPTLAFAGGKVALAYYDLRDDRSEGFEDLVFEYGLKAYRDCTAAGGDTLALSAVISCMLTHPEGLSRRHTLDMRAAMVDAACLATGTCHLETTSVLGSSTQVSRYREGRGTSNGPRVQLQYNRPNLPIFSKGRFPFIGDYIDIAGQNFLANADGSWSWNNGDSSLKPAPVFHVTWADNRNVGTPRDTQWANFTPAVTGPNAVMCTPGQTGIRNQDVYTAQLRPGLVVSAPQNSKRVVGLQRSFVVIARNTTSQEHDYLMEATPPDGVIASFDQFSGFGALGSNGQPTAPLEQLIVRIPPQSSVSRTLFVALENPPADPSAAPDVLVPVTVEQLPEPTSTLTAFDVVFLNPDFENPDFENPDFENTELHNPDFENPDFENPDFENPDFENFTLSASSSIRNPDFENPDFENPDFENPDFENPDFENPDFENPDFENPDFENPDFENPDFENPDFENPDFENGAFQVADTTWPVRNNGNTTSAYKTNVYVENPPEGVRYQLAVRRIFTNPAAVCAAPGSNAAPESAQSVPLVNIVGPNVQTNPFDRSFNDPSRQNATFALAPGERGVITLRAYCEEGAANCTRDLMASLQGRVALGVVAQGANCATCTGAACTLGDFVVGPTECSLETGPPKDIYDPIAPSIVVLNPTLTSPETVFVATDVDNSGVEPVNFTLQASDNVAIAAVTCTSPDAAISFVSRSNDQWTFTGAFPVGTAEVTCMATDVRMQPAPNAAEVEFLVLVKDVTPPTFDVVESPGSPFVPSNPAEATSAAGAVVHFATPTATDVNGGTVTVQCASSGGLVSGSTFAIGTTPINCVATDKSGVSTPPTNLFDISVADTTPPVITLTGPAAITIEAGSSYTEAGVAAYDVVSGAVPVTTTGSVNAMVPGTYTVTYTAVDAAGNTVSVVRTVTVVDTKPPVVTAVATPNVLLWSPNKTMTPVTISGTVSDSRLATVTYTVKDEYQMIQPSGTVSVGANGAYAFVVRLEAFRNGTDSNGRVYTVIVKATDAAGNVATASTVVLVPHNK
jgi:hypothetical protein